MAHKLYIEEVNVQSLSKLSKLRKLKLPHVEGRFGLSLSVGSKELFIGISINPVTIEQITKKRIVPLTKSKTNVFGFDPLN